MIPYGNCNNFLLSHLPFSAVALLLISHPLLPVQTISSALWTENNANLSSTFQDEHLAVYSDISTLELSTFSFFPLSQAWKYVKETYGSFGKNPRLYILLHKNPPDNKKHHPVSVSGPVPVPVPVTVPVPVPDRGSSSCKTHSFLSKSSNFKNTIDCTPHLKKPQGLLDNFQIILSHIVDIIREAGKGILNNADSLVCDLEMNQIVLYDLFLNSQGDNVNVNAVKSWKSDKLNRSVHGVHFIRDWFLPIYNNYGDDEDEDGGGGAAVLNNFYTLTKLYWPKRGGGYEFLNVGEFVHFWSGAAGVELLPLAEKTFKWSIVYEKELSEARLLYPFLNNTVNNQKVTYSKPYVTLYFKTYAPYPGSLYETISEAWKYVRDIYGPFQIQDRSSPLSIFLHVNGPTPLLNGCITPNELHSNSDPEFLNVIDCDESLSIGGNAAEDRTNFLDEAVLKMTYLALQLNLGQGATDKTADWPARDISGWSITSILIYDVYSALGETEDAERWIQRKRAESASVPHDGKFWFRDWYQWYINIYLQHGHSSVLIRFLSLLNTYWPNNSTTDQSNDSGRQHLGNYVKQMNMGEFVHFWSAAAGKNLESLARLALGWNKIYEDQFDEARREYPSLNNYTCENCEEFKIISHANKETTEGLNPITIVVAGSFITFSLALLVFGILFWIYRRKMQKKIHSSSAEELTVEEVEEFVNGNIYVDQNQVHASIYSKPFDSRFELAKERLEIDRYRVLGSGEFGLVYHGVLKGNQESGSRDTEVAVKTVRPNVEVSYFKALLSEIKILAHLGHHENIAELLATVTDNIRTREVFVALEFCRNGDLLHYLRKNSGTFQDTFLVKSPTKIVNSKIYYSKRNEYKSQVVISSLSNYLPHSLNPKFPIYTLDLLEWSCQIADGMAYLSAKNVIHGDLAARNVLLTSSNVAKISDFGLSRQFINYSVYKKKSAAPIPWKWLAPESLCEMKFSVQSDVWSYGVTLWEIFTLGKIPYPGKSWDHNYVNNLVAGERMEPPEYGSEKIYNLMLECWKKEPADRISFLEIVHQLSEILETMPIRPPRQGSPQPQHETAYVPF